MTIQTSTGVLEEFKAIPHKAALWLWLSILAVLFAIAGNIVALLVPRIYADLTPVFFPQAIAQDIASLVIDNKNISTIKFAK